MHKYDWTIVMYSVELCTYTPWGLLDTKKYAVPQQYISVNTTV